jgi:hypothetical protein
MLYFIPAIEWPVHRVQAVRWNSWHAVEEQSHSRRNPECCHNSLPTSAIHRFWTYGHFVYKLNHLVLKYSKPIIASILDYLVSTCYAQMLHKCLVCRFRVATAVLKNDDKNENHSLFCLPLFTNFVPVCTTAVATRNLQTRHLCSICA